ncbi:unnamed protein product [Vitrella brassicaformis CCMP3155]|uniref:Phospholipase B-like n=2 Tax=Vitrella brassicaformis TaxID=1169539 RepID=A0A0G4F8X5_VITBC|nr:unnamed protein product [Vitrella brassicaformis CCMP3155]|eukprot:CEM09029.1 unnamed protein product [Vitrella brassicaformis CCMP3155]
MRIFSRWFVCLLLVGVGRSARLSSHRRLAFSGSRSISASLSQQQQQQPNEGAPSGQGHHQPSGRLFPMEIGLDMEACDPLDGLSVCMNRGTGQLRVIKGLDHTCIAYGWFNDTLSTEGWGHLYLRTSGHDIASNDVKMYAAGYAEGFLSAVRIGEMNANLVDLLLMEDHDTDALQNIGAHFERQLAAMKREIHFHHHTLVDEIDDPYLKHVRYAFFQLWGMMDGYNDNARHFHATPMSMTDMIFLNSHPYMGDLRQAFNTQASHERQKYRQTGPQQQQVVVDDSHVEMSPPPEPSQPPPESVAAVLMQTGDSRQKAAILNNATTQVQAFLEWSRLVRRSGHCSAMVKVTDDGSDVLIGHTTWSDYSTMTRIWKRYELNLGALPKSQLAAPRISFSSYAGFIGSGDSFYVLSSGLLLMDTTLPLIDKAMHTRVADEEAAPIPLFLHVVACGRTATTGTHLTSCVARQNTGYGSSQWMAMDYGRFRQSGGLTDNAFFLLEQSPGLTHFGDITHVLSSKGHFLSTNRPYYDDVAKGMGYIEAQQEHGNIFSYDHNPRAVLLAHHSADMSELHELRQLMTRNRSPLDNRESGLPEDPSIAIAARFDLSKIDPIPNGAIDAKVVNKCLFAAMMPQGTSGPPHIPLPAFKWRGAIGASSGNASEIERWPGWPHRGLPNEWAFHWTQIFPSRHAYGDDALDDIDVC